MSNYEDDQSEDGELARSPVQDEMDFRYVILKPTIQLPFSQC